MAKSKGNIHGVLVIDKPEGPTSHDIVGRCRRIFGTRRVGHAGTLDPMATGVLVVLLGEATKLSSVLTRATKSYEATVTFGTGTDSLDRTGKVVKKRELPADFFESVDLGEALARELYREIQIPPLVSALKVDGRRAYDLAREGQERELEPRSVLVHSLELLRRHELSIDVRLTVSKGYYVRSFARDLGETLGVPAHLSELRRIASGQFDLALAHAYPPPENARLLTLEEALHRSLPSVTLTDEGALRALQGKPLTFGEHALGADFRASPIFDQDDPVLGAFYQERLVALLEPTETQEILRVRRGIVQPRVSEEDDPAEDSDEE